MTTREQQRAAHTAFEHNLRTEQIIWLACQSDQYAEDLHDFFNGEIAKIEHLEEIIGVKLIEQEREAFDDCNLSDDDISSILARMARKGRLGFLVKVATPCPNSFSDSGYSHSGFGYYTTQWFYTDVLDAEFMDKLAKWQEEYIAEQRKQALAKK